MKAGNKDSGWDWTLDNHLDLFQTQDLGQNMGLPSDPMSASQVRRVSLLSPAELTAQLAAEAAAVVATRH